MGILYTRVNDGDSSATIEISIYNDNETTLQDLIDLSTLRKAVGPNYSCRITRVFYSVAARPIAAAAAPAVTDHVALLGWNSGDPVPDVFLNLSPGTGLIQEIFIPTSGLASPNPLIYVEPYTAAVLHITLDKVEGFPLSLNKPKRRAF